jgi:hypothetical protein
MTLLATRPSWSFQDLKAELTMSTELIHASATLHERGMFRNHQGSAGSSADELWLTEKGRARFRNISRCWRAS